MINISQVLKDALLSDNCKKNITIKFDNATDFSRINFAYVKNADDRSSQSLSDKPIKTAWAFWDNFGTDHPINIHWGESKRCVIEYQYKITNFSSSTSTTPTYVAPQAMTKKRDGSNSFPAANRALLSDAQAGYVTARIVINTTSSTYARLSRPFVFTFYDENGNPYTGNEACGCTVTITNIHINLGQDQNYMPYEHDYQAEYYGKNVEDYITQYEQLPDVTNSAIEKEQFSITECLDAKAHPTYGVSGNTSCQFTIVNDTSDFTRRWFTPYISAEGIDESIPLGKFMKYSESKTGANNVIRREIEAYDKLSAFDENISEWFGTYNGVLGNLGYLASAYSVDDMYRQKFEILYNVLNQLGLSGELRKTFVKDCKVTRVTEQPYNHIKHNFDPSVPAAIGTADGIEYARFRLALNVPSGSGSKTRFLRIKLNAYHASVEDSVFNHAKYSSAYGKGNTPGYTLDNGGLLIQQGWDIDTFMVNNGAIFAAYVPDGGTTGYTYISAPYRYYVTDKDTGNQDLYTLDYDASDFSIEMYEISIFESMRSLEHMATELATATNVSTARDILAYALTEGYLKYGRTGLMSTLVIPDNQTISETILMDDYKVCKRSEYTEMPFNYVPHETLAKGMPWLECGDRIVVTQAEGNLNTLILMRTLNGIYNLTDEFEATNIDSGSGGAGSGSGGGTSGGGAVLSVNGKIGDVVLTTNDLRNNSGFITNTVNNLTNYYKKTETYTQAEVDALISAISTISFEMVQTLPTTDIKTNVIYLVPKSTAQTNNTYDEYINTTGTSAGWEKIGDTTIDLSGYYKTSDVAETNLADGDYFPFYDASATAKRKTLWSNIKTKLKDYFDTLYATISSIGNGTLTIQKNGTTLKSFSANQSGNDTVNITVPTNTNELTNGAGFITSSGSCAYATNAGTVNNHTVDTNVPSGAVFTDTTYGASNGMTLTSGNKFKVGERWTAVSKGLTWSRLFYCNATVGTVGSSGILAISCTRTSVVVNLTLLITASHQGATDSTIIELASSGYSYLSPQIKYRIVVKGDGRYYFEVYDQLSGATASLEQTWNVCYIPLTEASLTKYTVFTDGSTIPSGFTAKEQIAVLGSNASAIRNITRNGSTFTATRQDGTTFTFDQQNVVSSVNGKVGAVVLDKGDVNLGNVPNVATNNQQPTFTQALSRTNISSGDELSTIFGKIMKWFADLKDLAFIAKDGTSSTKYLRGDGTWQAFPTIPTVNNGLLIIKKNGTKIQSFGANQSEQVIADIIINISDINADANFDIGTHFLNGADGDYNFAIGHDGLEFQDATNITDISAAGVMSNNRYKSWADIISNGGGGSGLTATELWTNPSPNSSFAAQTITLSQAITNYTYYEIVYKLTASGSTFNATGLIPTDKNVQLSRCHIRNTIRTITVGTGSNANKITVDSAGQFTNYGVDTSTTANTSLIPYKVIGFK